jgi:hypothetical protein
MQYMVQIWTDEATMAASTPEQMKAHVEAFQDFVKEVTDRGIVVADAPLQPVATATTVRVRDGEVLTTDGPFAETKEQLVGFFLFEVADLDEAIELASRIPAAAIGSIEVRPVNLELRAMVHGG